MPILEKAGVDLPMLKAAIVTELDREPRVQGAAAQRLSRLACYASGQGKARLERLGARVEVRLENAFSTGRARINCTMPTRSGRWRWYGLQFYVPKS